MGQRTLAGAAVALALALPATAAAGPVSQTTAHRAIRHWWADKYLPPIHCVEKRYGTLCKLRIPAKHFDCQPNCDGIFGYDTKLVWVSYTRGKLAVANLGDYLSIQVAG